MNKSGRGARRGSYLLVLKEQNAQRGRRSIVRKARGGLSGGRNAPGFYPRPRWGKIMDYVFIAYTVRDKIVFRQLYVNPILL